MQKLTSRTAAVTRPDPIMLGAATMMTLALLACGESKRSDARTVEPSSTPTIVPVEVRDVTPLEISTPSRRAATFAESEEAFRQRRYGEATEMFESYVSERPKNSFGYYMLGLSAWKAGQPQRAESAFVTAIALDTANIKSHLNLTRVLLDLGRGEDALTRINAAVQLDGGSAEAHRLGGRVLTMLGRPSGAVEAYRVALSIDSTDSWSMNNLGLLLIRQGRFEEALGPLARAVELQPGNGIYQNNLGVALERSGRYVESAAAYRAAHEGTERHPTAGASLERVSALKQKVDASFVSLEELASTFAEDVRGWRAERDTEQLMESAGVVIPD